MHKIPDGVVKKKLMHAVVTKCYWLTNAESGDEPNSEYLAEHKCMEFQIPNQLFVHF